MTLSKSAAIAVAQRAVSISGHGTNWTVTGPYYDRRADGPSTSRSADSYAKARRLRAKWAAAVAVAQMDLPADAASDIETYFDRWDCDGTVRSATHYWMNSLQGVSDREQYFVTVNPPDRLDPAKVLRRFDYAHPLFTLGALRAQPHLPSLNRSAPGQPVLFCGSYFRYGFHEDGLLAAEDAARALLGREPW